MKRYVVRGVCSALGLAICFGIGAVLVHAQQPPTLGKCQHPATGAIVNRVNTPPGQRCNGFNLCHSVNTCAPVAGPCPNGAAGMIAETSQAVLVGTCQASGTSFQCNRCPAVQVCALFEGYRSVHPVSGACGNACGVSFNTGGNCK